MPTILKSEKLTTLSEKLDKLKPLAVQCRAEGWHLTKLLSPQIQDVTVIRSVDDGPPPTKAYIGIKNSPNKPGVLSTGANEVDEAARKEDVLRRTLAGETLPETIGVKEQLEKVNRQYAAYEAAIEHLNREIEREKTALAIQYCEQRKPEEADLMRRLCKSLIEVHAVWTELHKLKQHLIDGEIGLHGLCLDTPEFLGVPSDKYSQMAEFLRTAKRKGYINSIPESFA